MPESTERTVRALLPRRIENMDEVLRGAFGEEPGFKQGSMALGFLREKAADSLGAALDVDILQVLAGAWCKARELHEYRDATLHPPEVPELVVLGKHEFTHTVHPVLEYTLGGLKAGPGIRFDLDLVAAVESVVLTVRSGHITAVGGGSGTVKLQLGYKGVKLHEQRSIDLSRRDYFKPDPPGILIP